MDVTWDAEVNQDQYMYFLKGDEYFDALRDHTRDNDLLFGDYDSAEFRELYPTSASDYTVQVSDTADCSHAWSAWEVVYEASCLEEGVKGRICTSCGLLESAVIAKTAHKWIYTCNKNNTHKATCSVCGTVQNGNCTFSSNVCTKCKGQRVLAAAKITKVSSAGYNKLKITWNKVEGATGYVVQYLKGSTWKDAAYNKITVKWEKAAGATGYLIYRKNGTKWEQIASVSGAGTTSYTHTSSSTYPIVAGTAYTYTVRSYTSTGKTKGLYDTVGKTAKTSIGKPSLTVTKTGTGLKPSWKKVSGASGYQIQRYSGGKWTVIKTVSSGTLSYTDKTAKKGTTYQYRVRAYRTYSGKRVYSAYSDVKKLKR